MRCFVDGQEILAQQLARRSMNFGQPIAGMTPSPYRIELEVDEFKRATRAIYTSFLSEIIDDEPYDDGSFEDINRLRELGWPSFDALCATDMALLLKVVKKWLALELLDTLFVNAFAARGPSFILNTLEDLDCVGNLVEMRGQLFPRRGTTALVPD